MKNNGKIRSEFVKESLLDYNKLANTLQENTSSAIKDILAETVLEQYAKILTEGEDEDEYDVEEVEDTDNETSDEDVVAGGEGEEENADETIADDGMESETETEDVINDNGDEEITDTEETVEDDGENGWSEFDKYKVSDGQYDFSNAEDEEIVKVYKLLKDDDQVVVTKNDDKVNIKDNETGAEYLIDLGGDEEVTTDVDNFGGEEQLELQDDEDMNESRIFEIALNEYDSNVGYTDNYQSKDVMTNPGMSEPGKNVNDWDKGVPKDSKKPWSGKKGDKSENQPFNAEKGKAIEEGLTDMVSDLASAPTAIVGKTSSKNMQNVTGGALGTMDDDAELEESLQELKTRQEHTANVGSTSRTDGDNGNRKRKGRSFHTAEKGQETTTLDNPYSNATNEAIKAKANKIFAENKELKAALMQFKKTLEEAAVTNVNLGNIIKLVMENSTTIDEKKEIISRFGNEAKTVEASNTLFENISRDLKKKSKMNIDESKEFAVNENKQINEKQLYRSNDILNSLDLMHRICK